MSRSQELERLHVAEAQRCGVPATAVLVDTDWDVGPVAAFLFPSEPVTLIDAATDSVLTQERITAALAASGKGPDDVARVIVTHGHSDHLGGARWLQDTSGCEVFLHREDVPRPAESRGELRRNVMASLGMTPEAMQRIFGWGERPRPRSQRPFASFTALEGGEVFEAGGRTLVVEHRPGHSPGHVWVTDAQSGSIFAGDYLLADTPTNAGIEPEPGDPARRRPMLELYHRGLEELAGRDAPVVFPAHGPPITDHRGLITRRLDKSHRRTLHVLRVLQRRGGGSPFDLAVAMYGERLARNAYDILADIVGRLDILASDGRAVATIGEDGVWRFEA